MLRQIVRVIVRPLIGLALGTTAGAMYAGLVGVVHLSVYGRWDNLPTFAGGCVLVGAVLGLLIAVVFRDSEYNTEQAGGAFGPARTHPRNATWPTCYRQRGSVLIWLADLKARAGGEQETQPRPLHHHTGHQC